MTTKPRWVCSTADGDLYHVGDRNIPVTVHRWITTGGHRSTESQYDQMVVDKALELTAEEAIRSGKNRGVVLTEDRYEAIREEVRMFGL